MKKKKFVSLITICLGIVLLTSGCGNVNLKNGQKAAVSIGKSGISSDSFYKALYNKYGVSMLVDMIDHKLFDDKYKTDSKETEAIDSQITQMKSSYKDNEEGFVTAIKQYFGVKDEDELRDMLSLEYKRNLAVKDYLKDNLTDAEINAYYKDNIIGDIKASHILISVDTSDKDSDEVKAKKESEAKKKAEEVIEKLKNGEKFKDLVKKYSTDKNTKNKAGNLGYFNTDSGMDENFMDAAKKLEVGKYTLEPVKTQYGYHIILKTKQKDKPKLSKVKDTIKSSLADDKLNNDKSLYYQTLDDVRKENKVVFKDSNLNKLYKEYLESQKTSANSSSSTS